MTHTQYSKVAEAAVTAYDAGLNPYPPKEDGSKQPDAKTWTVFRDKRLKREQLSTAFDARSGLGVFTGRVFTSAGHAAVGLECFEFDDPAAYAEFMTWVEDSAELRPLAERIRNGYEESTPSGGIHWLYYCATVEGNQKLAQRPKRNEEKQHDKDTVKTLIETRGVGGWVVTAPSNGRTHKSGKPYVLRRGGFNQIATLTTEERQLLFAFARSFDQMPEQKRERSDHATGSASAGTRPGDDFNRRATWADVLTAFGWRQNGGKGQTLYWLRPGAAQGEKDATTNADGTDRLFVHSTSAAPLDASRYYTKFSAFAVLKHGGDFNAASADLRSQGYGGKSEEHEKPRFKLYTINEYRQRPKPRWKVKGILLDETLAALVGDFGTYKSFVALDMALAIASGTPWCGHDTAQAPCAYVVGEGGGLIVERIDAWLKHHGIADVPDFYLLPEPVQMLDAKEGDALLDALSERGIVGGLVVLDTLARTFGGGNENAQEDMNRYVAAADRIKTETGATVLILHHNNKSGEYRGSTVLPGALDTMLATEKTADGVLIQCEKQKDRAPFGPIRLKKVSVALDDGELTDDTVLDAERLTSLVFVPDDSAQGDGESFLSALTANERALLNALKLANDTDGPVSTSRWEKAASVPSATFYRLRALLIQAAYVATVRHGRSAFNEITDDGRQALEPKANPFGKESNHVAD
jgi:tellurite resistance-related uncharacterized protein